MATFTTSLAAGENKSGWFTATLTPGSTITLSADSAARAAITPVNWSGRGTVLSIDNNEGGNGDAAGIGNASTSWTVPAGASGPDGAACRAFVFWKAYNWQGPGSITIDGLGTVTSESETPESQWSDIFEGEARRFIAFPPEGGEVEFALKNNPELEFDCREWMPGRGWTSPFAKYFSATIAGGKLTIRVSGIPEETMKTHGEFSGVLKLKSGETAVSIGISAGYLLRISRAADSWQNVENGHTVPETDITDVSNSSVLRTLEYYPEDLPAGTVKLKVAVCDITNPDNATAPEWIMALLYNSGTLSEEIESAKTDRSFCIQLDCGVNLSTERRLAEVVITPDISPRSAIRAVLFQDPYDENEKPQVTINPETLEFDAAGGEQSVEVTASFAAGVIYAGTNEDWIALTSGGMIRVGENSGEARTGTVDFLGDGTEAHLTVLQKSAEESIAQVSLNPGTLQFEAIGGSARIEIAASASAGTVDVTSDSPWLTATPGGLIFIETNFGEARTGTAVFYGENGGAAVLTVSQAAYVEAATVSVSPDTLDFTAAGGEAQIRIAASATAGAISVACPEWIDVTPDGVIRVAANVAEQAREATLEFIGGNMPAGTGASITVTQTGARKRPAVFYRGTQAK